MTETAPGASLAEIRGLLDGMPEAAPLPAPLPDDPDLLQTLHAWLSSWQARAAPSLARPRAALYLGCYDDRATGEAETIAAKVQAGDAPVLRLCREFDVDLRLYEMAAGAAGELDDAACATAMAYGMMSVEDGLDFLCVSGLGPGVDAAGLALADAVFAERGDPLDVLRRQGGHALAGLAGAVIAARIARVPVMLDGLAAAAAGVVLHRLDESALDHCLIGPLTPGGPHAALLDRIGKAPVADFGLAPPPGCGGLIALPILRGAVASQTGLSVVDPVSTPPPE